MDVMNWDLKQHCLEGTLSLTDLQKKLFPEKYKVDRAPLLSEDKYTPKTLEGNWFERRAPHIQLPDHWESSYNIDYKSHVNETWHENQVSQWDNKLNFEGLPQEILLDHRKEYYNNMTSTYDLYYNILPRGIDGPRNRKYNARQRKWIPEQDLIKSFGNLTQFGLRDMLNEELYKNSEEGIAKCRWSTTYKEEIGQLTPLNAELNTQFHKRSVDFNKPDLTHLKRKSTDIERCLLPLKIWNSKLTTNSKGEQKYKSHAMYKPMN